ncbi:hypothetical protein OH77DRAFT_1422151 [Trametes cingulata]|nr:hypothetical protein OH77DRAFT_1422151 [Trametes cingulata]
MDGVDYVPPRIEVLSLLASLRCPPAPAPQIAPLDCHIHSRALQCLAPESCPRMRQQGGHTVARASAVVAAADRWPPCTAVVTISSMIVAGRPAAHSRPSPFAKKAASCAA